jgi:hypothetical protein
MLSRLSPRDSHSEMVTDAALSIHRSDELTATPPLMLVPSRPQTTGVGTRWEVDEDDWEQVSRQIPVRLEKTARDQTYITYGKLVDGIPEIAGPHSHALAAMLGEISTDCHAEGKALRPVW